MMASKMDPARPQPGCIFHYLDFLLRLLLMVCLLRYLVLLRLANEPKNMFVDLFVTQRVVSHVTLGMRVL